MTDVGINGVQHGQVLGNSVDAISTDRLRAIIHDSQLTPLIEGCPGFRCAEPALG